MTAVIFANGSMKNIPEGIEDFSSFDLIIAADGGLAHCKKLGLIPDIIVGDMDSAKKSDLEEMAAMNVRILQQPRRKDETDLELALKTALECGENRIAIIGALGARWDMTLSNLLILGADYLDKTDIKIYDGATVISRIKEGQTVEFKGKPGDGFSIIPLKNGAEGVTLSGLEYLLNEENLPFGSTRGLSNIFINDCARVSLKKGLLLVVIRKK